jgi:hypothetical protein
VRVTFDSNAWEAIFDPKDSLNEPLRQRLENGSLKGFICDTAFRIEAIKKSERDDYFQSSKMDTKIKIRYGGNGKIVLDMSIGPADELHPGIPAAQLVKLEAAIKSGVRLLRGMNWLGLPSPKEIHNRNLYALETTAEDVGEREHTHACVMHAIEKRGVGRAVFEALGGWSNASTSRQPPKKFQAACAEWSDGETVSSHIAYKNDILCTNDFGRSAGKSIFDADNRTWLTSTYGVQFATLDELRQMQSQ